MNLPSMKELTVGGVKLKELYIDDGKVWQSGRLPAGYTEVEYIKADSNVGAYIDLGFAFDGDADRIICIDENGKICFDRAGLLAYAHGEYYALGEKVGWFGFSTKKQSAKKPPQKSQAVENKPKNVPVAKETDIQENKKRPFYLDAPRGKGSKQKGGRKGR